MKQKQLSASLTFNLKEPIMGRIIPRQVAKDWIEKYQSTPEPDGAEKLNSLLVSKKAISAIFVQPECDYIRIYFASKIAATTDDTLVLIGTDKDYNDVLDMELIIENLMPCPPFCKGTTILNAGPTKK